MPAKTWKNRRLVIDASILRAAGETEDPKSIACRSFLQTLQVNTKHLVVETPDIVKEWDKHASGFAKRWVLEMESRDRVYEPDEVVNEPLREKIAQTEFSPLDHQKKAREAMLKDVHLAEAALATDKIVSALDDTVRKLFAQVCVEIKDLGKLVWVNPNKKEETPLEWLKAGAKPEKERCLKSYLIDES